MEVEAETSTVEGQLVAALEQATLMAKHLPTTADPSQLLQIHAAIHSAHHHLSLFLSQHQSPPPPTPTPYQFNSLHGAIPAPPPENSVSSAVGGENGGGEPMQTGDEEDEQSSRAVASVEKVEWRMREFCIQNKRPKRQLSPSSAAAAEAEQRRSYENRGVRDGGVAVEEFDPVGSRLRSIDLIYQFHA